MRIVRLLLALAVVCGSLSSRADIPPSPYAELTERGRAVRGLFVSTPHLAIRGHRGIGEMARAARLDAVVLDVKDERGRVLFPTDVPALRASRVVVHRDLRGLAADLRRRGHYVIGRIVCFKDDTLANDRPDLAVIDRRTGRPWRSNSRSRWLDPGNADVQSTIVALAREVEDLGFDEVQFDYVRYPVDRLTAHAVFPSADGTLRRRVIARFLHAADSALGIPISVDVFGLTTFRDGDPTGIGQSLEDMAPYVEVISPMLYASDFGTRWIRTDHEHPIGPIVWKAVRNARERLGHGVAIRPYLQAFGFRAPGYGPEFMKVQIQAARGAGADGFLFWNPGTSYGTVFQTLARMGPLRR
jgi:hypothetical protein